MRYSIQLDLESISHYCDSLNLTTGIRWRDFVRLRVATIKKTRYSDCYTAVINHHRQPHKFGSICKLRENIGIYYPCNKHGNAVRRRVYSSARTSFRIIVTKRTQSAASESRHTYIYFRKLCYRPISTNSLREAVAQKKKKKKKTFCSLSFALWQESSFFTGFSVISKHTWTCV